MQPRSITLTSSGSTPWHTVNWHANPINVGVGVSVTSASSQYQLDVTLNDPSSGTPTIYPASAVSSNLVGSSGTGSSANQVGAILQPIAALRLTSNSTTVNITMTILQSGIG